MSEFITIQVGQCGNQIGSAFWPLTLQEYGISLNSNGTPIKSNRQTSMSSFFNLNETKSDTVFSNLADLYKNEVKARVLCIDMEDSVVARYRSGKFQKLFNKRCLITNYPGSGNNWAEGYHEHGPKYREKIQRNLHRLVEESDHLHGFLLLFSTGGGTGSGLGTYVLEMLEEFYPAIERYAICVYPTGIEDVITCPYNMAFSTEKLSEFATCVFPVENRALYDILSRENTRFHTASRNNSRTIFTPFQDLNTIIVDMMLHLTSGSRFPGQLNFDMNDINTNMIPYPNMNFLSSSFQNAHIKSMKKQMKDEIFHSISNKTRQLIKTDPFNSKNLLLSATLLGRGDYSLNDMRGYAEKIYYKKNLPIWSKNVVKIGLCDTPPIGNNISMFSLYNTTSISNLFQTILNKYLKLYSKKAHVHHYTKIGNFDADDFKNCKNSLEDTIESYKYINNMQRVTVPRLYQ